MVKNQNIVFVGWIKGMPWQRKRLIQLGVFGPMNWSVRGPSYGIGVFSYCYVTEEGMERLIREWQLSNPGSFTAVVEKTEEQLSSCEQKVWYEKWRTIQAKAKIGEGSLL